MVPATTEKHSSRRTELRRFLTVPQVAEQLGLAMSSAYDLAKRLPPGVRVKVGARVRVDAAKLEQWLDAGGDVAAEQPES